eukprot:753127-Hanusia_phi.AAC.3
MEKLSEINNATIDITSSHDIQVATFRNAFFVFAYALCSGFAQRTKRITNLSSLCQTEVVAL